MGLGVEVGVGTGVGVAVGVGLGVGDGVRVGVGVDDGLAHATASVSTQKRANILKLLRVNMIYPHKLLTRPFRQKEIVE